MTGNEIIEAVVAARHNSYSLVITFLVFFFPPPLTHKHISAVPLPLRVCSFISIIRKKKIIENN